jgi:hypothetical protein
MDRPDQNTNGITIEQIDGKWAVQVVEDGVAIQQLFETEEFAMNFAEGQRLRLGLAAIRTIAREKPRPQRS